MVAHNVEVERFVREEDIETVCSCAAKKCGPHRCWPSKVGWIAVGLLLLYTVILHSFAFTSMEETLRKELQQQEASLQGAITSFLQQHKTETLASLTSQVQSQMAALDRLVERAAHLEWAVLTPPIEQAIALKAALEAVDQRVATLERTTP